MERIAGRAEHRINMQTIIGGWLNEDVAKAQLECVIEELTHADEIPPYIAFRRAMTRIESHCGSFFRVESLLDVGCGVGHYGVLCERHYPGIRYHGTDASESMIDEARKLAPLGRFAVSHIENNNFFVFDIVLLSQAVEMTDDPPAMLRTALDRAMRYVILNRVRLTKESSHQIKETTYCGNIGHNWLWNLEEIEAIITQYGKVLDRSIWDNGNQSTFVIEVNRDQHTGLCSRANAAACACA